MKRTAIVLFFAAFLSVSGFAQSVQDGVNFWYAKRYQSAKAVFDKLLAANPNNIEAIYWLGQNYIAQKDIAGAKAVYDKALVTNGNAPLLIVGAGNVDLFEGKKAEARSRFETAINTSKGKKGPDPLVLNAIGRAIVSANSEKNKQDLDYAITKLNEAAAAAPNNGDIFLNLGNAYRAQTKGGDAVTAYIKASQLDPTKAVAPYRIAMIYKGHTIYGNKEGWGPVVENLKTSLTADPKFAPALEEMYYYTMFTEKDYATAKNLSQQLIANADPTPEIAYIPMNVPIIEKKWDEVVTIGKRMISEGNPSPRVYRALTLASFGLKDTTAACNYINQFFTKASDEDILSSDYIMRAQSCGRGNPEKMRADIMTAIQSEDELPKQIRLINSAIDDAKASNDQCFIAELKMTAYQLRAAKKLTTSPNELIRDMVIPFYLGGCYQRSDSVATEYIKMAPDSIYGYYWRARTRQAIDTGANPQGLFVEDYEKTLQIGLTDTVRYSSIGPNAARSLAIYYANEKKDYKKAMDIVQTGKKFNPTDPNLLSLEEILKKYLNRAPGRTTPPTQKTNTATNQAKSDNKQKAQK